VSFKTKNFEFNLKNSNKFLVYECKYDQKSFEHKIMHLSDPNVPKLIILLKRLILEFKRKMKLSDLITSEVLEVIFNEDEDDDDSENFSKRSLISLFVADVSSCFNKVCDEKIFSNALFVYSKKIVTKVETPTWVFLEENCVIHWQFLLQKLYDNIFIQNGSEIVTRTNLNYNIVYHIVKEYFRGSHGFSPCGNGEEWRYFKGCKKQFPNYSYTDDLRTLLILEKFNYLLVAELYFVKKRNSNFNVENGLRRIEEAYRKGHLKLMNSSMVITDDLPSKRANMINFYDVYDPLEIWLELVNYHPESDQAECKVIFDDKIPLETRMIQIQRDIPLKYDIGFLTPFTENEATLIDFSQENFCVNLIRTGNERSKRWRFFFRPRSVVEIGKRKLKTPETCISKRRKRLCSLS